MSRQTVFVYFKNRGVHHDTTEEDIVNDLASSGIKVETKDVQLKSKEDSNLRSFKISVPASDIDKALDPGIWPGHYKGQS